MFGIIFESHIRNNGLSNPNPEIFHGIFCIQGSDIDGQGGNFCGRRMFFRFRHKMNRLCRNNAGDVSSVPAAHQNFGGGQGTYVPSSQGHKAQSSVGTYRVYHKAHLIAVGIKKEYRLVSGIGLPVHIEIPKAVFLCAVSAANVLSGGGYGFLLKTGGRLCVGKIGDHLKGIFVYGCFHKRTSCFGRHLGGPS